jgi:hypothetical protein
MSHMTLAPLATSDTESGPLTAASTLRKHAPVGSARRRWLDTTLMGGLGRILIALAQPRPHHPHRQLAYFEAARMSRAMDRL